MLSFAIWSLAIYGSGILIPVLCATNDQTQVSESVQEKIVYPGDSKLQTISQQDRFALLLLVLPKVQALDLNCVFIFILSFSESETLEKFLISVHTPRRVTRSRDHGLKGAFVHSLSPWKGHQQSNRLTTPRIQLPLKGPSGVDL